MTVAERLRAAGCEVAENYPLAARTSVRVGGPARFFVRPNDSAALIATLQLCAEEKIAVVPLGGGANCIVGDGGVDGCVLRLGIGFSDYDTELIRDTIDHVRITFGAATSSGRIAQLCKELGLVGAEFIAGIPGTLGGMVTMNAGTRAGEMASVVDAVEITTARGATWLNASALGFAYRRSMLPPGGIVTRVRLNLRQGSPSEIEASGRAVEADREYRKRTQPLTLPNSGSVFANPPGEFAGQLIERCGLKGRSEGGAQISEKHANWIVNTGGAYARNVVALMALAQREVKTRFGVTLRPEVKLLGTFDPPLPSELIEVVQ